MYELSSHYGWWHTHAGWVERRDQAMAEREQMIARYRAAQRMNRSALNSFDRLRPFDKRRKLRESGVITDRYSTRAMREAAATASTATFADYRPLVQDFTQSLLDGCDDLQQAHAALVEVESMLADLAFEPDVTASQYLDPRTDDEIEEEREDLSLYAEALEDVSAAAFDLAMEDRIYGRPSGLTTMIREAVRDGWACVPDYTDAIDNPVMVASDRGLTMAIDAEHHPTFRRLRDREAARLFRTVQEHRRWIEAILLDLDEDEDETPVAPVFETNADELPRLRQGWLAAKAAGDGEAMVIFERVGKLAAPVYRERQEMAAEQASVERITLHC